MFTHAKGTVIFVQQNVQVARIEPETFKPTPDVTINSASHFGRFLPEILLQFFKNLEKIQFYEEARLSDHVYLAQMSDEPMGGRGSNIFDHDSFF